MLTLPPKTLLKKSASYNEEEEIEAAWREAAAIESRCDELGIPLNIVDIKLGPQVVLFECVPAEKIPIRSLATKLREEIAYALGSESVSIECPVRGEKVVGIYTSRAKDSRRMIKLGDLI
jgi:DNA segregation ATPase FtsK/SpoIIIE-like protein